MRELRAQGDRGGSFVHLYWWEVREPGTELVLKRTGHEVEESLEWTPIEHMSVPLASLTGLALIFLQHNPAVKAVLSAWEGSVP